MKKFFAILICSIIIFCHFVPIVPGQAAEVVIEQGIDFFYKSWDMIYSLINGGVIQTSPYQGIADQTTALAAYYDDWGENLLNDEVVPQRRTFNRPDGFVDPNDLSQPAIWSNPEFGRAINLSDD